MMSNNNDVIVIIPNYNGMRFLPDCMEALNNQSYKDFDVLIVDNASTDGSMEWINENKIPCIRLEKNLGFAGGVNAGIRASEHRYIILLNNDTKVEKEFVRELVSAIKKSDKIFSVSSKMIQSSNTALMDDAGDGITILGWAYQIGVGESVKDFNRSREIFSACAGAAIYDNLILKEIGLFDELHFAYLEDIDLGYRARLCGYKNIYEPRAKVYHFGSGTSGSKYNDFKVRLSARNNIYLHYKNQSALQLIINSPFLCLGIFIKGLFFLKKGFIRAYIQGNKEGLATLKKCKKGMPKNASFSIIFKMQYWMIMGMFDYISHFLKRKVKQKT